MKKGLTLKQMEKAYQEAKVFDNSNDFVIKKWKEPFLWIIWFFIGFTTISENFEMYWLDFGNKRYLLKTKELEKH